MNPDTFAAGQPLGEFATIREEAPVSWYPAPGTSGDGFWLVTTRADIEEVSRQPDVFSSYERGTIISADTFGQPEEQLQTMRLLMLNIDPPEHSHLRNIVQRAFTPRTIRSLEPQLTEFAHQIVDRALAQGAGDFVEDIASEMPLLALCELMGIPNADRAKIFELSNRMVGFDDPEYQTSPADGQVASMEMYVYADELAAEHRANPKDDIISRLLRAEIDGDNLTSEQFDVFFLLLAVAGNETTRNAISHGMQAFFDNPEQWEIFKTERPLDTAAEEIIRWATPVMHFQRTAMRDYVLGGQQVSRGERVLLMYTAANRDGAAIAEPDTFDVRREANPHVAFGGGGPHFCLGANLARAEVRIMFDVLADRIPDITPTEPPRALRSMFINGIKRMPVRYPAT
ncbi:cytochrome P450 [Rhodococcus sp. X156]|uniref:cytochrome P450 n=1 Tax=Rhodococcus sp. X156 TaxID=2499145 RepID=UPI000FD80B6F